MPLPTDHLRSILAGLAAGLLVAAALSASQASASSDAGTVRLMRPAESDFDRHTLAPGPAERSFMAERFWRMRTYAPYFDERLAWFPNAWTYRDLYAIYRDGELARRHPEWILRDRAGQRLYIPFDCGGGSCTQFAGDIGNPSFRAHWIAEARRQAAGYRGIFIDDVNLEFRVSDGTGRDVVPHDPRTGGPMRADDWRRYMAEFTEEVSAAFAGKEIVHNVLWFVGSEDAYVRRQLDSATHIELERGAGDPGLTGGGGPFGYETFLAYIDGLHARGKGVVLDSYAASRAAVEYELATLFLVSNGSDSLGSGWRTAPDDWWNGYEVDLGAPAGKRYAWQGLLRRDFARGFVLVNQPGASPVSVAVGEGALDPAGEPRPNVQLGPGAGAVVVLPQPGRGSGPVTTKTVVRSVPIARVGAVRVRGRVGPAARGGRVRLRVDRRAGRRWVSLRSQTARVRAGGRFKRRFAGLVRGRYRVHARFLGSQRARPSAAARRFALRR